MGGTSLGLKSGELSPQASGIIRGLSSYTDTGDLGLETRTKAGREPTALGACPQGPERRAHPGITAGEMWAPRGRGVGDAALLTGPCSTDRGTERVTEDWLHRRWAVCRGTWALSARLQRSQGCQRL